MKALRVHVQFTAHVLRKTGMETWINSDLILSLSSSVSPWQTNHILSCSSLFSQTEEYQMAGKWRQIEKWKQRDSGGELYCMCLLVMVSCISSARVTMLVATAWVRGWHQRYKLSDRLWKGFVPRSHCSLVNAVIQADHLLIWFNTQFNKDTNSKVKKKKLQRDPSQIFFNAKKQHVSEWGQAMKIHK